MKWLGALICGVAAYLLAGSPLATAAYIALAVNLLAIVAGSVSVRSPGLARAATAVGHMTTALIAFFLIVWLATR